LVFYPVLHCEFLVYDDADYVSSNSLVMRGLTFTGARWAFTTGHMGNWHPLTWLSHMTDVQLYALNPFGHHLTGLLFHIVNTVLLFFLLRRATGRHWSSAVFGWHPLHVESVAWIAERKDVLSTFFELLSLHAYVRYAERPRLRAAKAFIWFGLALFWFALGLMSKAMIVTMPLLLLLLDIWPLRRLQVSAIRSQLQVLSRLVLENSPLLLCLPYPQSLPPGRWPDLTR
jgi:hypothetical protein